MLSSKGSISLSAAATATCRSNRLRSHHKVIDGLYVQLSTMLNKSLTIMQHISDIHQWGFIDDTCCRPQPAPTREVAQWLEEKQQHVSELSRAAAAACRGFSRCLAGQRGAFRKGLKEMNSVIKCHRRTIYHSPQCPEGGKMRESFSTPGGGLKNLADSV